MSIFTLEEGIQAINMAVDETSRRQSKFRLYWRSGTWR